MSCFLTYMAVRTPDTGTRYMLTYARLILQEAIRHEGSGWLHYDRVFRKQAAIDPIIQWNSLQPSLHASAILGQKTIEGSFCTLCKGYDHSSAFNKLQYHCPFL